MEYLKMGANLNLHVLNSIREKYVYELDMSISKGYETVQYTRE